jgi:hypothetical protein
MSFLLPYWGLHLGGFAMDIARLKERTGLA